MASPSVANVYFIIEDELDLSTSFFLAEDQLSEDSSRLPSEDRSQQERSQLPSEDSSPLHGRFSKPLYKGAPADLTEYTAVSVRHQAQSYS
jgi:hypothetical protein